MFRHGRYSPYANSACGCSRRAHPMLVASVAGPALATVAQWELTVALPAREKGTHMSRFVALLEQYRATPMTPACVLRHGA